MKGPQLSVSALRTTVSVLLIGACSFALAKAAPAAPPTTSSAWSVAAQSASPVTPLQHGKSPATSKPMLGKVPDAQLQRILRIRLQDDPATRPFAAQAVVQNGRATLVGQTF